MLEDKSLGHFRQTFELDEGGIGEYFGVDATLVRLAWVLFCTMGGCGILAYLIAAIIIPRRPTI